MSAQLSAPVPTTVSRTVPMKMPAVTSATMSCASGGQSATVGADHEIEDRRRRWER